MNINKIRTLKANSSKLKAVSGFTLIEILIVVSIIGLLASIIFVGLGASRAKGRDARRVADLRSIQTGLELYFSKTGVYPDALANLVTGGIGVTKIPKDPSTALDYGYSINAKKNSYVLVATTEAVAGDAIYTNSAKSSDFAESYVPPVDPNCGVTKYCVSF